MTWDTNTVYMCDRGLRGLGESPYITDEVEPYQGSYWPNEPPVLAPNGFYWYDYGHVGRNVHYWRAIPVGTRPSAQDQALALAKHRKVFENGKYPKGLPQAMAEHGLELDDSKAYKWWRDIFVYSFVFTGGVGLLLQIIGIRKRGRR